jgi:ubiquinone/menaquinone biosynthesis C-methylase UbiE
MAGDKHGNCIRLSEPAAGQWYTLSEIYDKGKAEQFWTNRVSEVDELTAVLSYNLPRYVNETYSKWELELLLKALGDIRGSKILDLGCGVGRVTMELLKAGAEVTSLDNSQKMLAITESKAKAASLDKKLRCVKSDASENPLPDASYDVVICVGLLEHLPLQFRSKTLEHLHRVLRSGGTSYIMVNNEHSIFLGRDASYEMTTQGDNGYFVGIIGLAYVQEFFAQRGATLSVLGSNFFYSYVRHTIGQLQLGDDVDEISEEMMRLALNVDLNNSRPLQLGRRFADQFLVRVSKTN